MIDVSALDEQTHILKDFMMLLQSLRGKFARIVIEKASDEIEFRTPPGPRSIELHPIGLRTLKHRKSIDFFDFYVRLKGLTLKAAHIFIFKSQINII